MWTASHNCNLFVNTSGLVSKYIWALLGLSPQYVNTDRSKAVLLLWFLSVTCSCCPYLYFGSPIMFVTYFSKF